MDFHRSNVLLKDGDVLTGAVQQPILGRESKVETLHELCAQRGITAQDVIAVGDGANDLGMLLLDLQNLSSLGDENIRHPAGENPNSMFIWTDS